MKKLVTTLALAIGLGFTAIAQTNAPVIGGPAAEAWKFITTEGVTNWFVVPFTTFDTTAKDFGGGVAVGYSVSRFVAPVIRFDYIGGGAYSAQADMQLQIPVKLFGKLEVIPFGFAGVATCIAGAGGHNGDAVGVVDIGGAVKLSSKFDFVADYELWTGGQFKGNNQIRVGLLYKF